MYNEDRQKKIQKEIETIKPRKIVLNLSDADCKRVAEKCGRHGISISQLFENFIGDLVDGTYSNGSDERSLANEWFNRCWFGMFPEESLLKWLFDESIDVYGFLNLITDIKCGYADLNDYIKDPSVYDEKEIKFLKTDIEDWEKQIADYKSQYMEVNPKADWKAEIERVNKWGKEKEVFRGCE